MTTIVQTANCNRCGRDFPIGDGKRVCGNCRAPKPLPGDPYGKPLSFRERQLVTLLLKARLNKEIASELHLTEPTVRIYFSRIFDKTGARNRVELAVWALTTQMAVTQ